MLGVRIWAVYWNVNHDTSVFITARAAALRGFHWMAGPLTCSLR